MPPVFILSYAVDYTEFSAVSKKLTADNLDSLKEMIDTCLSDPVYAQGRQEVRAETWEHEGEGTQRAVDYILNKYQELTATEDEK